MAALAVGPFLPVLAAGGLAVYLSQGEYGAPPVREPSDEQRRRKEYVEDMRRNGASASHWQNLHNKTFLMGASTNDPISVDFTGGGYNSDPNVDILENVWTDHADLADFDRQDTFSSLVFNQGEIRMRRRMPIVATLTAEIYNPKYPEVSSNFGAYRAVPQWANPAQINQAAAMLDPSQSNDKFLRDYHDQEFFTRAPGQSFRYE